MKKKPTKHLTEYKKLLKKQDALIIQLKEIFESSQSKRKLMVILLKYDKPIVLDNVIISLDSVMSELEDLKNRELSIYKKQDENIEKMNKLLALIMDSWEHKNDL